MRRGGDLRKPGTYLLSEYRGRTDFVDGNRFASGANRVTAADRQHRELLQKSFRGIAVVAIARDAGSSY